ncbi:MAG: site-specific integrase [Rhodobacteraceae bacterium]|nr:site-specific integrase [Paracoccaceae bacterium]
MNWLKAIQEKDLLDTPAPLARFSKSQQRRLQSAYGRWLGFVAKQITANPQASGADALTPSNLRAYIDRLKVLFAPYTIAGFVTDLETVLRAFNQDDLGFVHIAATTLRRLGQPVGNKRTRLRPSSDLYRLGVELMNRAQNEPHPHVAACMFQDGLMIALLAARPVRLKNLASIEIGRHLVRHGDHYWLVFPASEIKNHRHLEFPLPLEMTDLMESHIKIHRPILMRNVGKWGSTPHTGLWVSEHGSKLNRTAVYRRIYKRTREHFGAPVTPHLFRDAAATSVAIEDPAHVGIITAILGHSNPRTGETYYNQATSLQAARTHHAVVDYFKQLNAQGV